MRMTVAVAIACLSVVGMCAASESDTAIKHYNLNIPRQTLAAALEDFAEQTGLQIALLSDSIDGNTLVGPLTGQLSAMQALISLLGPRGLSYKIVNDHTIAIVDPKSAAAPVSLQAPGAPAVDARNALRFAHVEGMDESATSAAARDASSATSSNTGIEEVVVTATKRTESLQKLPQAITALTGKRLDDLNALGFQDYFRNVPGLMLNTDDRGHQNFSIRGLNNFNVSLQQQTTATVGQYIDEIPVTANDAQIDMRLVDIDRIEVLRGPQGTYYGEGSLGGTIRILTKKPDLNRFSAGVEGRMSQTARGGTNNQASLLVNLPLVEDKLALRANYFNAVDSGYIDVVNVTDQASATIVGPFKNDDNYSRADGGRMMALFVPVDSVTILAEAFHTKTRSGEGGGFDPTVGDLLTTIVCSASSAPGPGAGSGPPGAGGAPPAGCLDSRAIQRADLDNLTVDVDLGWASLVSATSWAKTERDQIYVAEAVGTMTPPNDIATGDAITQELRLVSSKGWSDRWNYVLGVFGNRKRRNDTGAVSAGPDPFKVSNEDRELALFGEAGYQFNARWSARFGARESNMDQEQDVAMPTGGGAYAFSQIDNKYHPITGRVTLNYSVSDDVMLYSSVSNGFRQGGANLPSRSAAVTIPASYGPDKAINYEIGWKAAFPSVRATLNGAVYHIDWKNAQTLGVVFGTGGGAGTNYFHNVGGVRVDGFELEGVVELMRTLTLQGAVSLINARLAEDYVMAESPLTLGGLAGDKMPFVAPVSGSLSLNYHRGLRDSRLSGFAILNAQYQGERRSDFNARYDRLYTVMDPYWITGAQLGMESTQWRAALYMENIFDERAALYFVPSAIPGHFTQTTNRPRTVGMFLRYTFQ